MAIEPGAYRSGPGPALWQEDMSYNQRQGMDLVDALRSAYQPEFEAQNKAMANLYRRRGLEKSGLYANAMARLGGEQGRVLDAGAMNVAQFLASQRQNAINRAFQQHQAILGAKDLAPQQDEGGMLAGALGNLAGAAIGVPGLGSMFGGGKPKPRGGVSGGFPAPMTDMWA